MYTTTGQFTRKQVESTPIVSRRAMKTNLLLRVVTTFTAIVLVSASAWAANHQIC
jgi:hypothetical protein